VKPSGERVLVDAPIGDSMLEVAHANKIEIEGPHTASMKFATTETSGDGVRRSTRDVCGASTTPDVQAHAAERQRAPPATLS